MASIATRQAACMNQTNSVSMRSYVFGVAVVTRLKYAPVHRVPQHVVQARKHNSSGKDTVGQVAFFQGAKLTLTGNR